MFRYLTGFVVIVAACLGLQTVALRLSGGKTLKSESNYFSSVARIQTETQGSPKVMLLGSSITGRLGDRAKKIEGVANLGCDGGSAMVTLRAMDEGILPTAPVMIIEGNTLAYELEHRGREIGAAIHSDWFKVGLKTPNLGATARPTAFAYSWLMARKADGGVASGDEVLPITSKPRMLDTSNLPALDEKSAALVGEMAGILERLKSKGSEISIIMLPGVPKDFPRKEIAVALACKSGVPWWDLTEGLPEGAVGFTDGLHLDAPSAQKVMNTLRAQLIPP
jgi:hypothetical protein